MIEPWPRLHSSRREEYRIFSTRLDRCRSPADGAEHSFVVVESPDWVNVLAITPADELVLVRQFRFGTREVTLEIPGGAVDEGEDFLAAGVRELREETGYAGGEARLLGVVTPNPAFMQNRCGTILVPDARRVGEPTPEGTELLQTELRPIAEMPRLVATGEIHHALVLCAFHWLDLHRQGRV